MHPGHGMTLTELLIVLALMSLLMAVATPDLQTFVVRHRGESALSSLTVAVQAARTAAIRSGRTVTLCRSQDGQQCGGSWSDGYIVFGDRNSDRRLNQDDLLLQTAKFMELDGSLTWRAFGNRQYLQMDSRGYILHQNGNFTYCPHDGDPAQARQLVISQTGRLRSAVDSDHDGVVEGSDGKPLQCP